MVSKVTVDAKAVVVGVVPVVWFESCSSCCAGLIQRHNFEDNFFRSRNRTHSGTGGFLSFVAGPPAFSAAFTVVVVVFRVRPVDDDATNEANEVVCIVGVAAAEEAVVVFGARGLNNTVWDSFHFGIGSFLYATSIRSPNAK